MILWPSFAWHLCNTQAYLELLSLDLSLKNSVRLYTVKQFICQTAETVCSVLNMQLFNV